MISRNTITLPIYNNVVYSTRIETKRKTRKREGEGDSEAFLPLSRYGRFYMPNAGRKREREIEEEGERKENIRSKYRR